MEEPLVQILVAVVISEMKSFTAEVDKVIAKMAISCEWADPKERLKSFRMRGIGGLLLQNFPHFSERETG